MSRRRQEISIRRVFGASTRQLTQLTMKEFFVLIGVALVLASPLAFGLASNLFSGFAHRIGVSPLIVVGTGGVIVLVTLLCVGFQSYRTALANPVAHLRHE